MHTDIEGVTVGESDGQFKVIMPAHRNRLFLAIYSVLMLVWIGVSIAMIVTLFGVSVAGMRTLFVIIWILILVVWAYVWYRLGRNVWRYFRYFAATREILFIDEEILIVQRPFAIMGVTDGYDMEHVGPFFYHKKYEGIAFEYGTRAGVFGQGLEKDPARQLARLLNHQFFPHAILEEE